MPTLCAHPTRWVDRHPVEWCPRTALPTGDHCADHVHYPATDERFEAHLTAEEAAA